MVEREYQNRSEEEYVEYLYSDADVSALLGDKKVVVIAQTYATGRFNLGQALLLTAQDGVWANPRWHSLGRLGQARIIHEIAERILAGAVVVSPELAAKYPDILNATQIDPLPCEFGEGAGACNFSELHDRATRKRMLALWRQDYTAVDMEILTKDEFFLALIDACIDGSISLREAERRLVAKAGSNPRNLSTSAFQGLAFELIGDVLAGKIQLPKHLRDEQPRAYEPERDPEQH